MSAPSLRSFSSHSAHSGTAAATANASASGPLPPSTSTASASASAQRTSSVSHANVLFAASSRSATSARSRVSGASKFAVAPHISLDTLKQQLEDTHLGADEQSGSPQDDSHARLSLQAEAEAAASGPIAESDDVAVTPAKTGRRGGRRKAEV